MRIVLTALTVLVMGAAVAGVGMGQAAAEEQAAPSPAATAAAKQRIAAGGARTARGRELFADEGCDACHSIAAIGAEGKLGPRLDTLDDDAGDIAESITEPREDIAGGFADNLMPADYGQRMSDDKDVQALATFVAAASGAGEAGGEADEGGEEPGRGRRHGGNSGSGGGGSED